MRKVFVLYRYHALSFWNWRSSYLSRFIEPLAYFAFLVAGVSGMVQQTTSEYPAFAFSGMICFLAFRSAPAALGDVANDRKWGIFAIYVLQGGGAAGYLASILLFVLSVIIVQIALIGVLSVLLFAMQIPVALALWQVAGGVLIAAGWIGFGAAVAAFVQSYSARDMIVVLVSIPLVLASPLFYRLSTAPVYLQILARLNPLTYQVAWLRTPSGWTLLLSLLWACVGITLSGLALSRADRVSRER